MEQPPNSEPQPKQPKKKVGFIKGIAAGVALGAAALGVGEALKNKRAPEKETSKAVPAAALEEFPDLKGAEKIQFEKLINTPWVTGTNPNNMYKKIFSHNFAHWLIKRAPLLIEQFAKNPIDPSLPLPILELEFQRAHPNESSHTSEKMDPKLAQAYLDAQKVAGHR